MARKQLTIDAVKQQFDQWRLKKRSGDKIPEHLWDLVPQLMGRYQPTTIIRRLNLSTKQMQKKGLLPLATDSIPQKSTGFINVKLPSAMHTSPQLTLQRSDRAQLSFPPLSDEQLTLLVKTFLS